MTIAANRIPLLERAEAARPKNSGTAWVLFLLLNATLFMRPAEIVPQLEDLPIYQFLILGCLVTSFSLVIRQLGTRSLATSPITLGVLGMLPAIMLSQAIPDIGKSFYFGMEFIKVILYYLLLVSLVNSGRRMQQFLICLAIFALWLCIVALLRYHNIIDLATIDPMVEGQFASRGTGSHKRTFIVRLVAAGIYGNPNDLARIIVIGITICVFALSQPISRIVKSLWLIPLGVFVYSLQLTYSRGGLLALLASLAILFHARFGLRKSIIAGAFLLPAILILFGGRQLNIDTSDGTGQLRIKLWSDGLVALRSSPLVGIGIGNFRRVAGNHAHNSFVEAYVETGFVGGAFFTCAHYLAVMGLYRLKSGEMQRSDPELWRLRPYILSLVVGSVVGQFSSARGYSLPTYMVLGLAASYLALAGQHNPASMTRVSRALLFKLFFVGVFSLVFIHLYTKFNAHF